MSENTSKQEHAVQTQSNIETDYHAILQADIERSDRMIANAKYNLILHSQSPTDRRIYMQEIQRQEEMREYFRLPTITDIEYRAHLKNTFAASLAKYLPDNSSLRFHGTSIMAAKHILSSGTISSAVDHDHTQRSMDIQGKISVTSPNNLRITINDYLNLPIKSLPIGCVFVLFPRESEISSSEMTMSMNNANLKPKIGAVDQFCAVLCPPESLDRVRGWLTKYGYPSKLAVEYFDFKNFLIKSAKVPII